MLRVLALLLSGCGAVAAGAAMVAASAQDRPGPTKPSVWVENRGAQEAIPIVVQGVATRTPMPVQISGTPTVVLTPGAVVQARLVRQSWEYRTVTVQPGQDFAAVLSSLGADGWEATNVQAPAPTGTTVVLKRPR